MVADGEGEYRSWAFRPTAWLVRRAGRQRFLAFNSRALLGGPKNSKWVWASGWPRAL